MHSLLNITNQESLLSNPIAGMSWESFVIENLLNSAISEINYHYYRTSAGAEIDLLIELPSNQLWAIEVKPSLAPKLEKDFIMLTKI